MSERERKSKRVNERKRERDTRKYERIVNEATKVCFFFLFFFFVIIEDRSQIWEKNTIESFSSLFPSDYNKNKVIFLFSWIGLRYENLVQGLHNGPDIIKIADW